MTKSITKEEVLKAQEIWGNGVVAIGKAFSEKGDFAKVATDHVDNLYAYGLTDVLFKPTKAVKEQFRGSKDSAVSYFVASNGVCAEDKGFALQPWTKVRFENTGAVLSEDTAIAMGNYYFTDTNGDDTKVEYTFGYVKDSAGNLRINLHHSSVPFPV